MVNTIERNRQPVCRIIGFGAPMLHIIQRKQIDLNKGWPADLSTHYSGLSCKLSRLTAFTFHLPKFFHNIARRRIGVQDQKM